MKDPEEITNYNLLNLLNEVVVDALSDKRNDSARKLLFFIKRSLRQFKLDGKWDESEILVEAYIRTRKKIIEYKISIVNIPAFLNRVSFKIIQEYYKTEKQNKEIKLKLIGEIKSDLIPKITSNNLIEQKIEKLIGSFEDLSPEDRKILVLKIVKGLSWKSIADRLDIRHDAARKRGERALKRLRERFFQ
ncbi:MAG: hypothetical protein F6K37_30620 [Moorea sp. SIO4E2]|uniref:sigma factor-like helix-turn-helix DNA-binding protein n=2 Tax=unclassified Moorena TaxID=2683338 RepID=UPI0013B79BF3|nr:sigma factor-like helix-turn-helix DNA-binding protein [Moorena sp. SIO4E2]NEQ10131.1 hypothetical protein [Moorena sp. SIO4E2]